MMASSFISSRQASRSFLLREGIANLHARALGLGVGAELFGRHRRAVNAVAPGLAADIYDGAADAGRGAAKDAIGPRGTPTVIALTKILPS